MKQKTLVYYETIDGQKFYENNADGTYDRKAQSNAVKHEISIYQKAIGEHKYYVIERYDENDKLIGYAPKIEKVSGITRHLKFAQKYDTIEDAYHELDEGDKIIGLDD